MDLARAVAQTLAYSSYFHFPLSPEEVHFWLISDHPVSFSKLQPYLQPLSLQDRRRRRLLAKHTATQEVLSNQLINQVRWLPGLELVALTGSVAIGNSRRHDDIDLLIVTRPNCLWLVRPFFIFFLSRLFPRRHPGDNPHHLSDSPFCPNLWLETSSLSLPRSKRNLYTAHEVLQVKPLYDPHQTYQRFLQSNRWVSRYLTNAYTLKTHSFKSPLPRLRTPLITLPFNYLFFLLQLLYMLPKRTSEYVTPRSAFFHKKSLSSALNRYLSHKTSPASIRRKKTL